MARALRSRIVRRVARVVSVIILVVLLVLVVGPQFADARRALDSVGRISPALLVAGLVLELASLAAFGALTRSALDPLGRPRYFTLLRIDLVGIGITNTVPLGIAASLAARLRLINRSGSSAGSAAAGLVVEGVTSYLALGMMFGAALLLAIGSPTIGPAAEWAAAAGFALYVVFAVVLLHASRHREGALRKVRSAARWLPVSMRGILENVADAALTGIVTFSRDRRRLAGAGVWAAANWLLDAAALAVFLATFGFHPTLPQLLLVYCLAAILTALPITPGSLGIVEGVMLPTLIALGATPDAAVLGVTAWRLVQFWLPIPLAGLSALSLAVASPRREMVRG